MTQETSNLGALNEGGSLSVCLNDSSFVMTSYKVMTLLQIVGHGKVLGTVNIEYDFSDCPKEWHGLALRILQATQPPRDVVVDTLLQSPEEILKDRTELKRLERNYNLGYLGRFFMWIGIGKWMGLKEYND